MKNSYKFFENRNCKYYPCHDLDTINCLFCYCPLYNTKECIHNTSIMYGLENPKVYFSYCENCTYPHKTMNYNSIIGKIKKLK